MVALLGSPKCVTVNRPLFEEITWSNGFRTFRVACLPRVVPVLICKVDQGQAFLYIITQRCTRLCKHQDSSIAIPIAYTKRLGCTPATKGRATSMPLVIPRSQGTTIYHSSRTSPNYFVPAILSCTAQYPVEWIVTGQPGSIFNFDHVNNKTLKKKIQQRRTPKNETSRNISFSPTVLQRN